MELSIEVPCLDFMIGETVPELCRFRLSVERGRGFRDRGVIRTRGLDTLLLSVSQLASPCSSSVPVRDEVEVTAVCSGVSSSILNRRDCAPLPPAENPCEELIAEEILGDRTHLRLILRGEKTREKESCGEAPNTVETRGEL